MLPRVLPGSTRKDTKVGTQCIASGKGGHPLNELLTVKERNMTTKKSHKYGIYLYVLLTIAGCVLACSNIIPNDYLKLAVVMGTLCFGLYGIMKGLSHPTETVEENV